MFVFIVLLIIIGCSIPKGAANASDDIEKKKLDIKYEEPAAVPGTEIAGSLVRLVFSLIFIAGTAWAVLRVIGKRVNTRMQGEWIRVIDELVLGPNKGILLCEVGGKIVAVGITDHQVSTLFEVTDEALIEEMMRKAEEQSAIQSLRPMSQIWEQARKALAPNREATKSGANRYFHTMMQEELRNIQRLRLSRENNEDTSKRGDRSE